jgi:hypothetical protein
LRAAVFLVAGAAYVRLVLSLVALAIACAAAVRAKRSERLLSTAIAAGAIRHVAGPAPRPAERNPSVDGRGRPMPPPPREPNPADVPDYERDPFGRIFW